MWGKADPGEDSIIVSKTRKYQEKKQEERSKKSSSLSHSKKKKTEQNTKAKKEFNKKDTFSTVMKIVDKVMESESFENFKKPVDWKTLKLFDYPEIVSDPMDFSKLRRKLQKTIRGINHPTAVIDPHNKEKRNKCKGFESSTFISCSDVYKDILRIWRNCKAYNIATSDIVKQCKICEKLLAKWWKEAGLEIVDVIEDANHKARDLAKVENPDPKTSKNKAPKVVSASSKNKVLPGPQLTRKEASKSANKIRGQTVAIYWDGDDTWFEAEILRVDKGLHEKSQKKRGEKVTLLVRYNVDGVEEELDIDKEIICLLRENGTRTKGSSQWKDVD